MASLHSSSSLSAVVCALPEEARWLRRELSGVKRVRAAPCDVVTGLLGGVPLALAVTGDGSCNAGNGLSALLSALPVQQLVVIGVSGALHHSLAIRTLLVGERVLDEGGRVLGASPRLLHAAAQATNAQPAVLVSAKRIADTPLEKQRLLELARPFAAQAAVDLESAAYASLADAARIPWLVLRWISDTADETLPAILNRSRGAGGGVSRRRVALGLLGNPGALPPLLALERRVRSSSAPLGRAARAVLWAARAGANPA